MAEHDRRIRRTRRILGEALVSLILEKSYERITVQELRWDTANPEELRKMRQWVAVGGYSLILWWAIIGGLFMTYLYSVAGLAYLHEDFLKTGQIPTGVEVPLPYEVVG